MYFMDPTAGVGGAVGSSGPVQVFLQAPPAQYPGQTSRLTMLPVVADSQGCGPTPPAQVLNCRAVTTTGTKNAKVLPEPHWPTGRL